MVAGLRLNGVRRRSVLADAAERALKSANLWDEVKDRLGKPGAGLSGGQQQRLCIARTGRGEDRGLHHRPLRLSRPHASP